MEWSEWWKIVKQCKLTPQWFRKLASFGMYEKLVAVTEEGLIGILVVSLLAHQGLMPVVPASRTPLEDSSQVYSGPVWS